MAKPDSPPGQGGGGTTPPPEPSLTVVAVIAPEMLGASGSITTGRPATIIVDALPLAGGAPTQIGKLENVSDGSWQMPAVAIAPGDYTIEAVASVSIDAQNSASVPPVVEQPPDTGEIPVGLSAIVTYNGTAYTFAIEDGHQQEDYVDPLGQFVQQCICCTDMRLPDFRVWFRPDTDSSRVEIVFELGGLQSVSPAYAMGSYSVQVFRDGQALADHNGQAIVTAPAHYYWTRWRWQSALRPVRGDIQALMADGLLPRLATVQGLTTTTKPTVYAYDGPMGRAGLVAYQPTTGDRPEIGPITEPQACYLMTEDAAQLSTVRAQLEAGGSWPWHYRDDATYAPIDWFEYPTASSYSASAGDPYIQKSPNCPNTADTAHEPSVAYVPFLLTGDPYALECLQFQCGFDVCSFPPSGRDKYCLSGALRAHAWALRNVLQAWLATPAAVPNWLLPRAHFERQLSEELTRQMLSFTENTQPQHKVFAGMEFGNNNTEFPSGCFMAPWMDDFECQVLGWLVRAGLDEWQPVFEWKARQALAMTNGTSGWVRARTTMYHLGLRRTQNDPWMTDWKAAWDLNVAVQPDACTYTDPNQLYQQSSIAYHMYRHYSLAQAAELGLAGAAECVRWLDEQLVLNRQRYPNAAVKWTYSYAV